MATCFLLAYPHTPPACTPAQPGTHNGWWRPSATEEARAAELGLDLLLVPGLTKPWQCVDATLCQDFLKGRRGDALLVVPEAWRPGAAPDRRMVYTHGGNWSFLSPFDYRDAMMQLASRLGAPIVAIDYPLVPVGSWKDQVGATLGALRWLAAWDGARGPGTCVCRPRACAAAVEASEKRGAALADGAPSMAQLLAW